MWLILAAYILPWALGNELIAEVRNIPDQCGLGDSVQYWVNTANAARAQTLQVVGGDFVLQKLNVNGQTSLTGTTLTTLRFDRLLENVQLEGTAGGAESEFQNQLKLRGGFALDCPKDKCVILAKDATDAGVVEFRNIDITVKGTSFMNLLKRIQDLELKFNDLPK